MEKNNNEDFNFLSQENDTKLNEENETKHIERKNSIFTPTIEPTYKFPSHTTNNEIKNRNNIFTPTIEPTAKFPTHTTKTELSYDDNRFISNYKKEIPIDSFFKTTPNKQDITKNNSQTSIPDFLQKDYRQQPKQTDEEIDKSINKSINKNKIKENKIKKAKKIIKKSILSLIILLILSSGIEKTYKKIQIHQQTEQIKIELVTNFQNELEQNKININDISSSKECTEIIKKNIDKFDKEFIMNNIFIFYLITNNDTETMNKLSRKAYGTSFSQYIKDLGYFEKWKDSQGNLITIAPSLTKWANAEEAKALNQKNISQETTKGVKK